MLNGDERSTVLTILKSSPYLLRAAADHWIALMAASGLVSEVAKVVPPLDLDQQVDRVVYRLTYNNLQGTDSAGRAVPALSAFLYQLLAVDANMNGDERSALNVIADRLVADAQTSLSDLLPPEMLAKPAAVMAREAMPRGAAAPAAVRVRLDRDLLIGLDMETVKNSLTNSLQSLPSGVFAYSVGSQRVSEPVLNDFIIELIISQISATSRRRSYDRRNFTLTGAAITAGSKFLERLAPREGRSVAFNDLLQSCQKDLILVFWNYDFPNEVLAQAIQTWWEGVRDQAKQWAEQTGKYLIVILANNNKDPIQMPFVFLLPLPASFDLDLLRKWLPAQLAPYREQLGQALVDRIVERVLQSDGSLMGTYQQLNEIAANLRKGKLEAI